MATYYRWRKYINNPEVRTDTVKEITRHYGSTDDVFVPVWANSYRLDTSSLYPRRLLFYLIDRDSEEIPIGKDSIISPKGSYVAFGSGYSGHSYGYDYSNIYEWDSDISLKFNVAAKTCVVTKVDGTLFVHHWYERKFVEYVYSTDISAYPNGGVSGDYYYDQRTTVTSPTAPTGLTYPNPITTPTVTVSWDAATSNVPDYPVAGYSLVYQINGNGGTSTTVISKKAVLSAKVTVPKNANTIRFAVMSSDTSGRVSNATYSSWVPVYLAPTLSVPTQLMQGQQATINWTAISGADSYTLQRKADTDADWVQVYSGGNTTFSETAGTWTSVQYRVQAVFSGTASGWATSASIPVISASVLMISSTDGDLGTVVNDIPYSISTDTGNQITAKITVNSAVIFSGNVGNSTAGTIPVLDLVNGTGTIVIEASVQATSGTVSAVRTWTYTKAEITFPNAGSVAQLTQQGANIWPKTLAECVRLPGGKTLDEVLESPCQVYAGSYVGTGTYGEGNPNELTFPFKPLAVFVNSGNSGATIPFIRSGTMSKNGSATLTVTWSGGGISWTSNNAANQLNTSGVTYYVFAIGIAAEPGVFLETPQYAESGSVVWNFSIPSGIEIPESGAVNVTVTMTRDGDTPTWTNGRHVTYAVDGADGSGTTAEALVRSSADAPAPTFTIQITNATQKAVYIRITNVSQ